MFAYPKGRPRKDGDRAKGGLPKPISDDIETRILKIRRDKLIPESSEWMVLLLFATSQMMRYMSMYPQDRKKISELSRISPDHNL